MERAGSRALSVFSRVLNARVLRAHGDGLISTRELEERLGWAANASLRAATAGLYELGALERGGMRMASTRLTAAGHALLAVADALEGWLSHSDFGSLELSDPAAQGMVRALVAGWNSTVVQALAGRPRSLGDLRAEIPWHSYPCLKRRFAKLRRAALVADTGNGRRRSPEYEATPFLRRAVAPLILAIRWEREHLPGARVEMRDLEALLFLALPLVELLPSVSGSCVLAMPPGREAADGAESAPGMVALVVDTGRITLQHPAADFTPSTWAAGSAEGWLDALTAGETGSLRMRGPDAEVAVGAIGGLQRVLSDDFG